MRWAYFRPSAEVELADIQVDLYLYGELASYASDAGNYGFANASARLKVGGRVKDLLAQLGMPTAQRGITFINGRLSAMPGLQPDLDHVLQDHDRVAFFDLKSMWPFQYRQGATMIDEMAKALSTEKDSGVHNIYDKLP